MPVYNALYVCMTLIDGEMERSSKLRSSLVQLGGV
jgi:hypothetical protein